MTSRKPLRNYREEKRYTDEQSSGTDEKDGSISTDETYETKTPSSAESQYHLRSRCVGSGARSSSKENTPHITRLHSTTVRTPLRRTPEKAEGINAQIVNNILILRTVVISLVLLGFIYLLYNKFYSYSSPHTFLVMEQDATKLFEEELKDMSAIFPNQKKKSWTVLRAAVKSILNNDFPDSPAVVLLVSQPDSLQVTSCLVDKLEDVVKKSFNKNLSLNVDMEKFSGLEANAAKLELDELLDTTLSSGGKVVVLKNIDKLLPEVALLFHGYCDNSEAPFKTAVMLLTVNLDGSYTKPLTDAKVENYLSEMWKSVGVDKVGALLSRIANWIVFVGPEPDKDLQSICRNKEEL